MAARGSNFGLTDYALAHAFGAWLVRNYGGPAALRAIVQGSATDDTGAVEKTCARISGSNRVRPVFA